MRRRDLRKHIQEAGKKPHKCIDMRSGFEYSADQVKVMYNGLVVSPENYDEQFWGELPVKFPHNFRVPFTRMEPEDYFIGDTEVAEDLVWGTANIVWSLADTNWGGN